MDKAWIALPLAALSLAACEKETGPEPTAPESAPAVSGEVPAATAGPTAVRSLASFAGMDSDGDGKVTSVEHAKATQALFQMLDTDKDGAVTVAEMDAAREASSLSGAVPPQSTGEAQSSEKEIAALDGDSDGKLTLVEYVGGSNALFARMDKNADDALDRVEWDEGHRVPAPTTTRSPPPARP